jgi:ribonuclease T1
MTMTRLLKTWCLAILLSLISLHVGAQGTGALPDIAFARMPVEAQQAVTLIRQGGPFPFAKDGAVFGNYERLLPRRQRGYYREYTVKTKGAHDRGARRIVVGGEPTVSRDLYYTDDHYASFKRIKE